MFQSLALHAGPSWRYHEAERCLRQKPIAQPRVNDVFINNYIKVVKTLNSSNNQDLVIYKLSSDQELCHYVDFHIMMSNTAGVKKLGTSPTNSNFTRAILDALALCDTDHEEIAQLIGLSAKTVEIYEALVFDVRDKPQFWVVSHVLSPIINSFSTGSFEAVLKFAGAALGRNAVNQLLFKSKLDKEDIEKLRETVYGWRLIKAAASTVMIPVTSFNNLEFERDVNVAHIEEENLSIKKTVAGVGESEEVDDDSLGALRTLFGDHPITISSKYKASEDLAKPEEPVVTTNLQGKLVDIISSNDVVRQT